MAVKKGNKKSIDELLSKAKKSNGQTAIAYCYVGVSTIHNLEKGRGATKEKRVDLYLLEHDILRAKKNFEPLRKSPKYHSYYVNKLINSLGSDQIFIVCSVNDISKNVDEFIGYYETLWDNDVDARFLDCSWIDIKPLKDNDVSYDIAEDIVRNTFTCAGAEKEAYKVARSEQRAQQQAKGEKVYTYHKNESFITAQEYESQLYILENNVDFGSGHMSDTTTFETLGISRNSYYKYKKNLRILLNKYKENKDKVKKYLEKELKSMKDENLIRKISNKD